MASLPSGITQDQDEDRQQQQQAGQPLLSGGGAPAPTSTGTASAPKSGGGTPGMGIQQGAQRSAMQPSGSGYVNLSSYLTPTVAKQNQQQVAGMGQNLTGSVQGAFDTTDKADREAIASNKPHATNYWEVAGLADKAGGGDTAAGSTLNDILNPTWNGPSGSTFDLQGNADFQRLAKLGGSATAFDALHPELKDQNGLLEAGYSQGNNWLDQAMIQGDAGTLGEVDKVKGGYDQLGEFIGGEQKKTGEAATSAKKAQDDAANEARDFAKLYIDNEKARATQEAKSANAERKALLVNSTDPEWLKTHMISGINDPGKEATAENFLSPEKAGGLTALAGYLGDPSLGAKSAGPYQRASFTQEVGPGATPVAASAPMLEMSDTYSNEGGVWRNKETGETFDGSWQFNPESSTWKNLVTGETKDAGRIFSKPVADPWSMLGVDAQGNRYLKGGPGGVSNDYTAAGNRYEYQQRRKRSGK